eukprot:TRINITY_DN65642_c8_g1_i1.p1 TRINITY_DN65642_c8_g1~~TRINITY_DN65642_c8_g1_i1.p1  ORF type:complete len:426 (-),score=196.69 TRINITY_DN65642_c8_g1_i1:44-1321(-)
MLHRSESAELRFGQRTRENEVLAAIVLPWVSARLRRAGCQESVQRVRDLRNLKLVVMFVRDVCHEPRLVSESLLRRVDSGAVEASVAVRHDVLNVLFAFLRKRLGRWAAVVPDVVDFEKDESRYIVEILGAVARVVLNTSEPPSPLSTNNSDSNNSTAENNNNNNPQNNNKGTLFNVLARVNAAIDAYNEAAGALAKVQPIANLRQDLLSGEALGAVAFVVSRLAGDREANQTMALLQQNAKGEPLFGVSTHIIGEVLGVADCGLRDVLLDEEVTNEQVNDLMSAYLGTVFTQSQDYVRPPEPEPEPEREQKESKLPRLDDSITGGIAHPRSGVVGDISASRTTMKQRRTKSKHKRSASSVDMEMGGTVFEDVIVEDRPGVLGRLRHYPRLWLLVFAQIVLVLAVMLVFEVMHHLSERDDHQIVV